MTRPPDFITFTGADDRTDIGEMRALASQYPIEWGILFSPSKQGKDNRFPSQRTLARLTQEGMRLSAHLCGGYSRKVVAKEGFHTGVTLNHFSRIQVNHIAPYPGLIASFCELGGKRGISQWRGMVFPDDDRVDWLFDRSGGRGALPPAWPAYPGHFVGYAGGINPDNAKMVIETIDATGHYWIDMEGGVRTNDWFDLKKVRAVCEAVFA